MRTTHPEIVSPQKSPFPGLYCSLDNNTTEEFEYAGEGDMHLQQRVTQVSRHGSLWIAIGEG